MWRRPQTSASGRAEAVFPRLGLFIWQYSHLLTKCLTSCVILGNHAIILTDASVAFFPGCVSCTFSKTKCCSLVGMKGTTPLKMCMVTHLCVWRCVWSCVWSRIFVMFKILFQLLNIVFNSRFRFVSLCPGRVCLFQVQFHFLLVSPSHSEPIRCYWLRSTLDRCGIPLRQNPFKSKHLHGVSALLVCTSTHNRSTWKLLHILWAWLMLSSGSPCLVQRDIWMVCSPSVG